MTAPTARLVSWGVSRGRMVVNTRAHVAATDDFSRTLCGLRIPSIISRYSRTGQPPVAGALPRTWHNSPAETAELPRCVRCGLVARSREATQDG